MTNWKTNLGGAVSVTGTTLIGVGVLGNMGQHSDTLWFVALAGFIFSAIGKGITALFAADASQVKDLSARVASVESNTSTITKNVNQP